ncbi:hypothetical protein [Streptomyces lanatus]|uniref:Uncharacterized protein n=1 Tax=Streptomyces lanatus TaxID=66900 RepID=A0ABV1Y095_9ACTN|nr:hypothetical protein [Streptomyces lanatus]GHH21972.1 hypothetical protein GCM10018780_69870 [Streptomyces lanatus]
MAALDDEVEPEAAIMVATCHTAGCPAEGEPCVGTYYANAEPPIYRGMCMPCGQPITDLVPYEESATQ